MHKYERPTHQQAQESHQKDKLEGTMYAQTPADPARALSLCEFIWAVLTLIWKDSLSQCPPFPLIHLLFLPPLLWGPHLQLGVPTWLTLCVMFPLDLCTSSHLWQEQTSSMGPEQSADLLPWPEITKVILYTIFFNVIKLQLKLCVLRWWMIMSAPLLGINQSIGEVAQHWLRRGKSQEILQLMYH